MMTDAERRARLVRDVVEHFQAIIGYAEFLSEADRFQIAEAARDAADLLDRGQCERVSRVRRPEPPPQPAQ